MRTDQRNCIKIARALSLGEHCSLLKKLLDSSVLVTDGVQTAFIPSFIALKCDGHSRKAASREVFLIKFFTDPNNSFQVKEKMFRVVGTHGQYTSPVDGETFRRDATGLGLYMTTRLVVEVDAFPDLQDDTGDSRALGFDNFARMCVSVELDNGGANIKGDGSLWSRLREDIPDLPSAWGDDHHLQRLHLELMNACPWLAQPLNVALNSSSCLLRSAGLR